MTQRILLLLTHHAIHFLSTDRFENRRKRDAFLDGPFHVMGDHPHTITFKRLVSGFIHKNRVAYKSGRSVGFVLHAVHKMFQPLVIGSLRSGSPVSGVISQLSHQRADLHPRIFRDDRESAHLKVGPRFLKGVFSVSRPSFIHRHRDPEISQ